MLMQDSHILAQDFSGLLFKTRKTIKTHLRLFLTLSRFIKTLQDLIKDFKSFPICV